MVSGKFRNIRPGKSNHGVQKVPSISRGNNSLLISSRKHIVAGARVPKDHRGKYKPRSTTYSHIQILPAPDEAIDFKPGEEYVEDFIRNDSLQTLIEGKLLHLSTPATSPAPPSRPLTFAEATMSAGQGNAAGDSRKDENGESTLSGPMSLETLGTFRYTYKKKKKGSKWAPLNLAAVDNASEVDDSSELGDSSRAGSPNLLTFARPPTYPISVFNNHQNTTTPHKSVGGVLDDRSYLDTDPTPTQERFDLAARELDGCESDGQDTASWDNSDTQSTRDRTEAAMSQITRSFSEESAVNGADAFDSLNWDSDMAMAPAPDQSPEPVTSHPKPITYTTVGSRVDPDAVHQFTAPNRIQREGPGRRSLMTLMQTRQHHDYYQTRSTAPSVNIQSTIQYGQHASQTSGPFGYSHTATPASARSSRSGQLSHTIQLTEQEKQRLGRREGSGAPQMFSGNIVGSPNAPTHSSKFSNTTHFSDPGNPGQAAFNFDQPQEEDVSRFNSLQGHIHGLEKMQTLQRLAKFENPMQHLARSRLSEFSAAKSQSVGLSPNNPTAALEALLRGKSASATTSTTGLPKSPPKPGELNLGYQFPSPRFNSSATLQTNPLYGAYSASTQPSQDYRPTHRSTYPQPLTAGPPGHRQYHGSGKPGTSYLEQLLLNDVQASAVSTSEVIRSDPYSATAAQSRYFTSTQSTVPLEQIFTSQQNISQVDSLRLTEYAARDWTRAKDTLSVAQSSKYYPRGFPGDRSAEYVPVTYYNQRVMGQIPHDPIMLSEDERNAKKVSDLDEWFYSGQRRWGSTIIEHITELEEVRKRQSRCPYGPIGPPPKVNKDTTCTMEELYKMTPDLIAAPLLSAAFASLLAYAQDGPTSRKRLSNMAPSDEFFIDSSEKGNESFYGEDWGAPPKKTGPSSRY